MKIAIGNDHAAVDMKKELIPFLESLGHEVVNFGTDTKESTPYPMYGEKVGEYVASGQADCGVLICGTGVGISLAANKVPGIRAAVCNPGFGRVQDMIRSCSLRRSLRSLLQAMRLHRLTEPERWRR